MVCKTVTTNISLRYNGAYKTFVYNCVMHKTKLNQKIPLDFSIQSRDSDFDNIDINYKEEFLKELNNQKSLSRPH